MPRNVALWGRYDRSVRNVDAQQGDAAVSATAQARAGCRIRGRSTQGYAELDRPAGALLTVEGPDQEFDLARCAEHEEPGGGPPPMSTGVRPATTGIPRLAGSRRPRHDHEFACSQNEVEIAQYLHLLVAAAVRLTDARELQYRCHAGTVAMQSVTMADNLPGGCCAAQSSPVHGVKGAVAPYCDLARPGAVRWCSWSPLSGLN